MFLAAGPYFQHRFRYSPSLLTHFQSTELLISCVANLGSMLVLSKLQAKASYPKRIVSSLVINTVTFTSLALSTRAFPTSSGGYFGFLMATVLAASLATGLCQNGSFALANGYERREEYTQAIMTGQAVAGVLPCLAQMASVLSVPLGDEDGGDGDGGQESPTSAFAYFLTATGISALTLIAFLALLARKRRTRQQRLKYTARPVPQDQDHDSNAEGKKTVPLTTLAHKLRYLALAVFLTFATTMVFPVFTQRIVSVRTGEPNMPRYLQASSFVPLAFLFWNTGDLLGRLSTAIPALSLSHRPRLLLLLSLLRAVFVPMYLLCNIQGRRGGAPVHSDLFYLVVVQLGFGLTNGYVGSACMMGAGDWVDDEEREAAGGFMGLCLVAGLTAGSLASFAVAGA